MKRTIGWLVLLAFGLGAAVLIAGCGPSEGLRHEEEAKSVVLRTTPWPPAARVVSEFEITMEQTGAEALPSDLKLVLAMPEMPCPDMVVELTREAGRQVRYTGSGRIDHGGIWQITLLANEGEELARFEAEVAP